MSVLRFLSAHSACLFKRTEARVISRHRGEHVCQHGLTILHEHAVVQCDKRAVPLSDPPRLPRLRVGVFGQSARCISAGESDKRFNNCSEHFALVQQDRIKVNLGLFGSRWRAGHVAGRVGLLEVLQAAAQERDTAQNLVDGEAQQRPPVERAPVAEGAAQLGCVGREGEGLFLRHRRITVRKHKRNDVARLDDAILQELVHDDQYPLRRVLPEACGTRENLKTRGGRL